MNRTKKHFWLSAAAVITAVAFIAWFLVSYFRAEEASIVQVEKVTHIDIPFRADGTVAIVSAGNPLFAGEIEIADNDQKLAQGLMYRDALDENRGMLFIFPEETEREFWMKNTRIPLDIIYIDSSGKIVSIAENARPYDETSLRSEGPARYVLEINGGLCRKLGIKPGDTVAWTRN